MAEVIIRRMTIHDVPAVTRLEAQSFVMPWRRQDFEFEMTENPVARYLVAEESGELLGFAGAHLIFDEGHITNVVVAESARGRGLGRRLMEALMQYAANLGGHYLTLEVRVSNARAIGLYTSLGFVKAGVRKRYYQDNQEDALLMVCDRLPPVQEDFIEEETVSE
ncbi:MAG TPA: ribosomal protein S18-alanine N-acetyltransferase [Clostridia bacterium]|nr:ribosomal protein S18-alanine N-acetyltransferase [Clostridia bacterium]